MTNPVQEGVQLVADSKTTVNLEFTPEDLERLAHPNIVVEESAVTLRSAPPLLWILVAVALYLIFLLVLFRGGAEEVTATLCAIAGAATLVFLGCLTRVRMIAVFDKRDRKVHRRNLVYGMASIDFDDIAEVAMVEDMGPVFFKISLKANRHGKGVRITRNYPANSEEFLYFVMVALPAINAMLGDAAEAEHERELAMLAEHPLRYTREGSTYTLTTWRSQITALALGVFMLIGFVEIEDGLRWVGLGMACFAFICVFVLDHRIVIDTERRTISFSSLLGWPKTTHSLDSYVGLRVIREHVNGIYTHTSVTLLFNGVPTPVNLYWSVWTKKLSAIVNETIAIIASIKNKRSDEGNGNAQFTMKEDLHYIDRKASAPEK